MRWVQCWLRSAQVWLEHWDRETDRWSDQVIWLFSRGPHSPHSSLMTSVLIPFTHCLCHKGESKRKHFQDFHPTRILPLHCPLWPVPSTQPSLFHCNLSMFYSNLSPSLERTVLAPGPSLPGLLSSQALVIRAKLKKKSCTGKKGMVLHILIWQFAYTHECKG